jgi:hypothetical protein
MWATSVIFQKLHKENNRPMNENSPNRVTLVGSNRKVGRFFNLPKQLNNRATDRNFKSTSKSAG